MSKAHRRLIDALAVLQEELAAYGTNSEQQAFAVQRQLSRLRKRAQLGDKHLKERAIASFQALNASLNGAVVDLDPDIERAARDFITEIFEQYNSLKDPDLIQFPFDVRHVYNNWRHGPGAVNGVPKVTFKGRNGVTLSRTRTHAAEKLVVPFSCTPLAKPLCKILRRSNVYLSRFDSANGDDGCLPVRGSRLGTVPKNEEVDRTTCAEPSGNMVLQLGYGEYVTDVLRYIGLDLSTQPDKNIRLARRGSVKGDVVTLDLKDASNMILPELLRRIWPTEHYSFMVFSRSPETKLPNGEWVQLNMMSTMGNGFTFPVMTMTLIALIYAHRAVKRGGPRNWIDWRDTAVFGDDIIVPIEEAEGVIDTITRAGFVVNRDKSYLEGPFRESCGGDFYKGYDVTPFYIKKLVTDSDIYVAINRIFDWCGKTKVLLHRSLTLLAGMLTKRVLFVPEWCGDDSGFRTPLVARSYSFLEPRAPQVRTKCPEFDVMLACGGYLIAHKGKPFYVPRPFKTRYRLVESELPRGYLDGRDPLTRDPSVSSFVEAYSFLVERA